MMKCQTPVSPKPVLVMMEERGEIYQGETARCIFIRFGPVGWRGGRSQFIFNLKIQLNFLPC